MSPCRKNALILFLSFDKKPVRTTSSIIVSITKLREKFYEQNGENIKHFITKLSFLKKTHQLQAD